MKNLRGDRRLYNVRNRLRSRMPKPYVFADSVLCLGSISDQSVEAWKNKIKGYLENRYLKDLNRIDGEPMEFEWKMFPGFTTLGSLEETQKNVDRITVWIWAVQRKDHLHVNVQRHCVVWTRKYIKMYCEFCYSCELCSQFLARTLFIFGTWIREEIMWNLFWRLGQDCWKNDAQLCRKWSFFFSCHRPGKRRIKKQRKGKKSFHFNGSDEHIELILRTIISVNQLSIYGAVVELCKELCKDSEVAGNLAANEDLESMEIPTELPMADPHTNAEL